jgi:hypothetical protein
MPRPLVWAGLPYSPHVNQMDRYVRRGDPCGRPSGRSDGDEGGHKARPYTQRFPCHFEVAPEQQLTAAASLPSASAPGFA